MLNSSFYESLHARLFHILPEKWFWAGMAGFFVTPVVALTADQFYGGDLQDAIDKFNQSSRNQQAMAFYFPFTLTF